MSSTTITRASAGCVYTTTGTTVVTSPPFSVVAWARADASMSADDYCIVQIENRSVSNSYYRLGVINDNILMVANDPSTGFTNTQGSTTISTNVWYHYAMVIRSATDRQVYLNGVSEGSSTVSRTPTSISGFTIGRELDSTADDSWSGQIAHVAVYNADISANFAELAKGAHPLLIRPASLVFYSPLDDQYTDWIGGKTLNSTGVARSSEDPVISRLYDQIYIPPLAGGATTYTKTTSLDALLSKANNLKTTSLDALLQKTLSLQASVDALLQQTGTKTTSLDSLLKQTLLKTLAMDSLLQGTQTKTSSLDSLLQKTLIKTLSLDAVLQGSGTNTLTTALDSLLKKTLTKSVSLDSLLQQSLILVVSLDALLKQTKTKTAALDSLLKQTLAHTVSIDALVYKYNNLLTVSLDSVVIRRGLLTGQLSAMLKAVGLTVSISIDSIIQSPDVWTIVAGNNGTWSAVSDNGDTWSVISNNGDTWSIN